jgi:solute carrier family 35 (UDP-galactose transporter), member B1
MCQSTASASRAGVHVDSMAVGIVKFIACVALIYSAYITQGRVAEQLSRHRYGAQGHKFQYMEALIGFQCIVCCLWAGVLWLIFDSRSSRVFPSPIKYSIIGITNVVGPICGIYALKNISYPAQVLAKSCKSVPIMLTGTVLYRKKYSLSEYMSVLAIGVGVALFAVSSGKAKGALHDSNPLLGYSLVLLNLLLDSLTNTAQDELHRTYPDVTSLHMMCWTNFWGGLYYAIAFFGLTGTGVKVISFCLEHKEAAVHLLSFCVCGALGQLGIFYTVASYGTLVCSIVCTTRKFFSILLSVILAAAVLTMTQSCAVVLVFGGLLYKSSLRLAAGKKVKAQ